MAFIASMCDIAFIKSTGRAFYIGNLYEMGKIKNGKGNIKIFIGPDKTKMDSKWKQFSPWATYFNGMCQDYCGKNFFNGNINIRCKRLYGKDHTIKEIIELFDKILEHI